MPVPPRPLPEGLGPTFGVSEAQRAGVASPRLRRKDLEAPYWGVRRRHAEVDGADDATPLALARATAARVRRDAETLAPHMPRDWFFAGRTAAVLHGGTLDHGDDLELAVFARGRTPRRQGVRGRKVAVGHVNVVRRYGLRVASAASAWAMLGVELDHRELVRLGDELVRIPRDDRGRPQPHLQRATLAQLRAAAGMRRRRGIDALHAALPRVRVGSMSLLETDWRLDAEDAGLPEPELDVEVRAEGRLLGIADGAYPDFGVLVEVEGDHHRTDPAQWDRDIRKHADYAEAGYTVVRLTRRHIKGPHAPAPRMVRAALERRGWRPQTP
jgi:hypothetical protein